MPSFKEMNEARASAVKHRYSKEAFTPVALGGLSNKQLTSELSKARSILRKRYERASSAGLYTREQAQRIQDLLTPIKEIPMDRRQEQLSSIARELSIGHSTVTEARSARDEFIENFQQAGYDYVTPENVNDFLEFLGEFSWKERDKFFGSGVLSKYFNDQQERIDAGEAVTTSRQSFLTWLSKEEGRYGTGISYKEGGKR